MLLGWHQFVEDLLDGFEEFRHAALLDLREPPQHCDDLLSDLLVRTADLCRQLLDDLRRGLGMEVDEVGALDIGDAPAALGAHVVHDGLGQGQSPVGHFPREVEDDEDERLEEDDLVIQQEGNGSMICQELHSFTAALINYYYYIYLY